MSGYDASNNSGFNGGYSRGGNKTDGVPFPSEKYYDYYETLDRNTGCNGGKCIGQNISEALRWYGGFADFISDSNPWIIRSGRFSDTTNAGVFSIGNADGYSRNSHSFRLVMSIN